MDFIYIYDPVVPLIDRKDRFGLTALDYACKSKDFEIIKELVKNEAQVKLITIKNRSILHILLETDEKDNKIQDQDECLKILKFLISNDAPIKIKDNDNRTLLHYACKSKQEKIIQHLLPYFENELDVKDTWGNTALILLLEAVKNTDGSEEKKYLTVVKSMLDIKSSLINISNRQGYTVFHLAAKNKQKDIMMILLSHYKKK